MNDLRIAVAGGGIGGLTAALALASRGHRVTVLERSPALTPVGAGVTLSPNSTRVFERLGLGDALAKSGVEPPRQQVQHWRDDRVLLALERGPAMRRKYGAPYLHIHRGRLQQILLEALGQSGRADLQLGRPVQAAVRRASGKVEVRLDAGDRIEADLLIGADGVKSTVRRMYPDGGPVFTGHVCWRTTVPITTPRLRGLASFPGLHIGPGRMITRYPLDDDTFNLVFFARQTDWREEGWTIPATADELEAAFRGWSASACEMVGAAAQAPLYRCGVFARRPLRSWIKDQVVVLLGDAAHAMTPFLGQGAACAIEDALILARAVDVSTTVAEALRRYEIARKPRCDMIQMEANANADRLQGPETELYGLGALRNEETLGLFTYDAGAAPV